MDIKNRLKISALTTILLSSLSLANQTPSLIKFEEGEQLKLSLSRIDFNRIVVDGEKIVELSFLQGSFALDKSQDKNSDSDDGAIYIKPLFDLPLTAFVETDKGHHFSLLVSPKDSTGSTIRLLKKNQTALNFVKKDTDDLSFAEETIASMKLGEIPKDFNNVVVRATPFYVKKDIKVVLEKQYSGNPLSGYVYRLENKSNRDISLNTELFANNNAEILSLSDEKLKPHQIVYLYGLYRNVG